MRQTRPVCLAERMTLNHRAPGGTRKEIAVSLYDHIAILYHLHGCRVFEDLSAICGLFKWGVPW